MAGPPLRQTKDTGPHSAGAKKGGSLGIQRDGSAKGHSERLHQLHVDVRRTWPARPDAKNPASRPWTVALSASPPEEQGRHYLWRFWQRLPPPGNITIFDRTWYGPVLVERVEALARPKEWQRAYDEINAFETTLIDDGIRLVKLFLNISDEEQLRRFRERIITPTKHWTMTVDDIRNRARRRDYLAALDDMLALTSTAVAPWYVVPAEYKWYTRHRRSDDSGQNPRQRKSRWGHLPSTSKLSEPQRRVSVSRKSQCSVYQRQSARRDEATPSDDQPIGPQDVWLFSPSPFGNATTSP